MICKCNFKYQKINILFYCFVLLCCVVFEQVSSLPCVVETCSLLSLQNAPCPRLAVYICSIMGLYTKPISICKYCFIKVNLIECHKLFIRTSTCTKYKIKYFMIPPYPVDKNVKISSHSHPIHHTTCIFISHSYNFHACSHTLTILSFQPFTTFTFMSYFSINNHWWH